MADYLRKCVDCGEVVTYDGSDLKYNGFGPCKKHPGKHVVEFTTYYHPGARDIQDVRDRKKFSPTLILKAVYDMINPETGKFCQTSGLSVQFLNGKLDTADPEIQYLLEQKPDIFYGESGIKMWREVYLTSAQQLDIQKGELADVQRQIKEGNDLLAKVKANQKEGKPASA